MDIIKKYSDVILNRKNENDYELYKMVMDVIFTKPTKSATMYKYLYKLSNENKIPFQYKRDDINDNRNIKKYVENKYVNQNENIILKSNINKKTVDKINYKILVFKPASKM